MNLAAAGGSEPSGFTQQPDLTGLEPFIAMLNSKDPA